MDHPYLTQLKQQRRTIETFLQADRAILKPKVSAGARVAITIYSHILEAARRAVNSLIQYLELKTGGNYAIPVSQILQDR
jgi:hypothetical protein